ncbi:MAG TPA: two-component system sensor histidine kinase RppB [Nostocaceae cyanobacterium]|nr:two-component system sensor histidine kinase RppB [Nostocaceae cyanobacterium]
MNKNQLFNHTRRQLSLWYAGVMGLILSVSGFGFYHAIAHTYLMALDRELQSVAGTLHDSLELKLQEPGRLEPIVEQFLPNLCQIQSQCLQPQPLAKRHVLSAINQHNYYVRLFDKSGKLIAIAGFYPDGISKTFKPQVWQTFTDNKKAVYHQISLSLHTQDNRDWGYIQVGRSRQELDHYLHNVKLILWLGLPLAMIFVGVSSWWLAGLAIQPIYQSYNQMQQFTADAAHELRTPLAALAATVESALKIPNLSNLEIVEIFQTVERQNRRLIQLVNDLLLLARLDQQALPPRKETCCLHDIVNDLVEELAALAKNSQITLIADIQCDKIIQIIGNEEQLYRLVSNLIINAIQYTLANGKVTVILKLSDNKAVIQVQDTGIGIASAEQSRIFDRFYRVNSDRSRSTGGSGLGLAIAQAIAQAHQGSLEVQSELGKGSIFTIRLPLSNQI